MRVFRTRRSPFGNTVVRLSDASRGLEGRTRLGVGPARSSDECGCGFFLCALQPTSYTHACAILVLEDFGQGGYRRASVLPRGGLECFRAQNPAKWVFEVQSRSYGSPKGYHSSYLQGGLSGQIVMLRAQAVFGEPGWLWAHRRVTGLRRRDLPETISVLT